ncbi:ABC transporter substrate-binding protein [Gymnodinialimonas sp. 2305UL16-5]|uniref:ABC transporter substrate-binding protein n=1 Tax=Gymnodinialimonas mytili TaxID=3126503 RepID=UPI0030A5A4A6
MKRLLTCAAMLALSSPAMAQSIMTYEEALACVERVVPAELYVTNALLPSEADLVDILPMEETVELRVGLSWVLDDGHSHFYNAIEQGYFADEGITVELVPGGPGVNHIQTLAGGVVDVAVASAGSYLPRAITSPTPIEGIMSVGSVLKGGPAAFITIDEELLGRELTPQDLVGRTVAGGPFLEHMPILLDRAGLDESDVTIINAGFTPDALFAGAADFYFGWIFNQTRAISAQGYEWNALMWGPHGFEDFPDSIVMMQEDLEENEELSMRFMRAVHRGIEFMLENPEQSAETVLQYATDAPHLTTELVLQRYEQQAPLVTMGDLRLLETDLAAWNENTATLLQYGFLPTVTCD